MVRIKHRFFPRCISFLFMFAVAVGLAATAASAEPVVIEVARSIRPADVAWQEAVVEAFNEQHDHIQVELSGGSEGLGISKLTVLLIAGEAPHIIYQDPNNLLNWARQGLLVDLAPYLDREPADSPFHDFFEVTWDVLTVDGRIWGAAMDLQSEAILYNADAFDEAGVAPPHENWTWDDLTSIGQKVMRQSVGDGPPERWGLRNPDGDLWWSTIWQYGGALVDDWATPRHFTGDSSEVLEAMRMLQNLVNLHIMAPPGTYAAGGSTSTAATVIGGHAAMAFLNSISLQSAIPLGYEHDTVWDVAPRPHGPAGNMAAVNSIGWAIVKEAGHTEEAFEVLRFFSGPTAMELAIEHRPGAVLPHRPTMIDVWLPTMTVPRNRHVFLDALPVARPLPHIPNDVRRTIRAEVGDFWNSKIPEGQMIENLRAAIESWIQSNRF